MSLLFDQNLSWRLPAMVAAEFPGSEQALMAGLATADDQAIWEYAAAHRLAIVSKDSDFVNLSLALGAPPKVVWLRVGNCSTNMVAVLLQSRAVDIRAFLTDAAATLLALP